MKKIVLCATLFSTLVLAREYEANLKGHITIDSKAYIKPPKDAPEFFNTYGKFANFTREEKIASFVSKGNRETDYYLPFNNQPIQGHSGIKYDKNTDSYFVLTDNGLGKKHNSYDAMLYMHNFKLDFKDSSYKLVETIFFNDKNKKYKYPITTEATKERYLSGADFDLESFQMIGGDFWVGDEFGPFLLHFDRSGTLKEVFEVYVNNKELLSPDNPKLKFADLPEGKNMEFNIKRSRGFEAMASYGDKLYLLLEGGIYNGDSYESVNGKEFLRIIEFDTKSKKYTNKTYKYFLEDKSHSIGDFNMIDKQYGLIIERDGKEGVADKQCIGKNTANCFNNVAKFKRIYKVKLENGEAKKIGYIDLLNINDNDRVSKKLLVNGRFVFPFETIEGVDIVDSKHIVVANDNNFPYSSSRESNKTDDNEFILLEVSEFLNAK
ncbi:MULTISPECIES: esterase-like activity of phytase family protein [Helicobacter]|uniref:Esterase-like activity of phytase family protein n=1 Tax=Helicobacter ibis TaxID=2962633 RepID=A0ABT4VDE6_9HELI|nr:MULTISPECIES: esterase-like activity of phytase family protein [Helicobacter]MDA3967822.1 esterase-like activity of phytase family protein [Helicobacter sp. WB40]MDA3968724.1 esterase-like activity of phytase family protein [Helicobacter ibis]